MTLDEAIKHAVEAAEKQEKAAKEWHENQVRKCKSIPFAEMDYTHENECEECAAEHRQRAEWLKELKQLREQTRWIPVSETLPKYNGWYQCTVIINDLPRTIELFYKNGKWIDNRRIDMFNIYDIYGYGNTTEKHKLSYQELISEFDWTKYVIAWKPLSVPFIPQESEE